MYTVNYLERCLSESNHPSILASWSFSQAQQEGLSTLEGKAEGLCQSTAT